jgi:NAD(P)H-hydrate repair Nnr-like enzyme with NAD(P)H-hydrate dehydratase domain
VVWKGAVDLISDGHALLRCDAEGGLKRSGGMGDILAGSMGVTMAWASMASAARKSSPRPAAVTAAPAASAAADNGSAVEDGGEARSDSSDQLWAALSACTLTRAAAAAAFADTKRCVQACACLCACVVAACSRHGFAPMPLTLAP